MKVCFFNTVKKWGGGENWHFENAKALKDRGVDVRIVAYTDGDLYIRAKNAGIETYGLKTSNLSFLNPVIRYKIRRYFEKEKFDAIIFNSPTNVKTAAIEAERAGIKSRILRRGSPLPIKESVVNKISFGHLTMLIANSEATKKSLYSGNSGFLKSKKTVLLYNGIRKRNAVSASSNNGNVVIGNLGRLKYEKGQDILVDIAKELKERGEKFMMKIGGAGDMEKDLKDRVKKYGIEDCVEFCGFIEDPYEFMNGIDIFALTSRWEGFGFVLAEAMMMKKPLVAFNVSGIPELVKDDENGYLVEKNNIAEFADKIELLISNAEKRKQMGEAGYRIVNEKFEYESNADKLLEYIKDDIRENG